MTAERIIDCGGGFWNVRGTFRIAGLLDVGTQASLVRRTSGRFVFLDSYAFAPETRAELDAITGGPEAVEAVINLHPFHTLHVAAMQAAYPAARHFGTARHVEKFPDLGWETQRSEEEALWAEFAPDLAFSVPAGMALVHPNPRIHCASILAFHAASGALHVDDTFGLRPGKGRVSVHPTLRFALDRRPGAAGEFRDWGTQLLARWPDPRWLCAAHSGTAPGTRLAAGSVSAALAAALARAEKTLARHAAKWDAAG